MGKEEGDGNKQINHVARNTAMMSKYREVQGIKTQINHDILYSRLYNSQQRAQMIDSEKRMKSVQWLNKWENFRHEKGEYVQRALGILKKKRRVINVLTLMAMQIMVNGIIENYKVRWEYYQKKYAAIFIAIKFQVNFRSRHKRIYGKTFEGRLRNIARRGITLPVTSMADAT